MPAVAEMFDGPASLEEFKANGEEFLGIYKNICGLRPDETMLDIGSGLGRKTVPLMPGDVEHYLSEIFRVMAPRSRCLISYFLLNDESSRLITNGRSTVDFKIVRDGYRTISAEVPEHAVALEESFIKSLYHRLGLKIVRRDYGSWCGRDEFVSYQDLVLAVKE